MFIALEVQLGDMPELKPGREFAAKVGTGVLQCCKYLILLLFIAPGCDLDGSVPGVRTDMDFRDIHFPQPWVVELKPNNFSEFLSNRLADP
jgi:hypothetical protein